MVEFLCLIPITKSEIFVLPSKFSTSYQILQLSSNLRISLRKEYEISLKIVSNKQNHPFKIRSTLLVCQRWYANIMTWKKSIKLVYLGIHAFIKKLCLKNIFL